MVDVHRGGRSGLRDPGWCYRLVGLSGTLTFREVEGSKISERSITEWAEQDRTPNDCNEGHAEQAGDDCLAPGVYLPHKRSSTILLSARPKASCRTLTASSAYLESITHETLISEVLIIMMLIFSRPRASNILAATPE